jgi:hypothetical protein
MPFFTHGDAKNKLIILYILSESHSSLTHDQLYRIVDRTDSMTYFSFETILPELETDGMVASFARPFGVCYALTQSGQESLSMFLDSIPLSARERIRKAVEQSAGLFLRETQTTARVSGDEEKGYTLELLVLNGEETVFGITLAVASLETALSMRSHWEERSAGLYEFIWKKLARGAEDDTGAENES